MSNQPPPVGHKLRQMRNQLGLTQSQLAELAGVDQTVISNLEIGGGQVRYITCVRIARALGHTNPLEVFPVEMPRQEAS